MATTDQTIHKIDLIKNEIDTAILARVENNSFHPDLQTFFQECNKILLSPDAKRIRPVITILVGEALNLDRQECLMKGILIELLHFTSLIHDDVIDSDTYRRGQPTLNNLFALNHAVLIGDFMMAEMIRMGLNISNSTRVIELLVEAIQNLVTGLLIEQNVLPKEPSLEKYLEMVSFKTGELFKLSFCYPLIGNNSLFDKAQKCGELFGLLFQIYDDYLDRESDEININIFHICSKGQIHELWNNSMDQMFLVAKEIGIEPVIDDIMSYLQANNYFMPLDDI